MVAITSYLLLSMVMALQATAWTHPGAISRRADAGAPAHRDIHLNVKRSTAGKKKHCSGKKLTAATIGPAVVTMPIATTTTTTTAAPAGSTSAIKIIPANVHQQVGDQSSTTSKPVTVQSEPVTPPPPTTAVAPTEAASSDSGDSGSGSDGLTAAQQATFLSLHNQIRSQHGAVALTWSDTLANAGKGWADKCVFEHSGGQLGAFGENLAAGTGSSYDVTAAMKSWTDEISQYDAGNPVPSHYTQVVWKGTTQVGCGLAPACAGIFDSSFGPAKYFVCEYQPQGNIIGQFAENVQ